MDGYLWVCAVSRKMSGKTTTKMLAGTISGWEGLLADFIFFFVIVFFKISTVNMDYSCNRKKAIKVWHFLNPKGRWHQTLALDMSVLSGISDPPWGALHSPERIQSVWIPPGKLPSGPAAQPSNLFNGCTSSSFEGGLKVSQTVVSYLEPDPLETVGGVGVEGPRGRKLSDIILVKTTTICNSKVIRPGSLVWFLN